MLNSIDLDDKSYEDLMAEALARIPLYSREWTNFNRSDPGITILQNLSAFALLQQGSINTVTDDLRRAMLALVGCRAGENRAATLLVQTPPEAEEVLPPQYQLRVGELCFETGEAVPLDRWALAAAYVEREGTYQDVTYLLDARAGSAAVFGPKPQGGESLCCVLEGTPPPGRPLRLWAQVPEDLGRNPFPEEGGPSFAQTKWQYFTDSGWADARTEDETKGFLVSGCVTLYLDGAPPAVFGAAPVRGCALRCLLVEADYDSPPRLQALSANLFPVRQWETRSRGSLHPGGEPVTLLDPLAARGNLFVYGREAPGGPYRQYLPYTGVRPKGRFYLQEEIPGGFRLAFDSPRFGAAPCGAPDAVLVVCCDDEMVHHRDLGPVYGYEDQEVALDLVEHLLPGRFSLLSGVPGPDGDLEWTLVPPGLTDPEALCYRVDPREGKLRILHPGAGTGARLFLCDCRVTRGAAGNLRPGGTLEHREAGGERRVFQNPAPGWGGADYETAEELRRRFAAGRRRSAAAVRASDYEELVLRTPGLCIHKVKAVAVPGENLVRIAVKPRSEEPAPALSPLYQREIRAWLEPRRMLTTRVELLQPRYVPVDVRCVAGVKDYYEDARGEIEALLREKLDYVNGPQGFGARVGFHQLYRALLELDCVEAVDDLRLHAAGVRTEGPDLILDERSLCRPGALRIELHARPAGRGRDFGR